MKTRYEWLMLMACILSPTSAGQPFSTRMLDSIMRRQQGIIGSGQSTSTLESGFLGIALNAATVFYPNDTATYTPYLQKVLDIISPSLIDAKNDSRLPLDRFSVANAINDFAQSNVLSQDQMAADSAISESLELQHRNYLGGYLYYAGAYPSLSYLDGVFSLLPFMASKQAPNYTEMSLQLSLLVSHCYQQSSGLVTHGYDANFTYPWAAPVTGQSPYVWGRSLGWFLAGLVQTWETVCHAPSHSKYQPFAPAPKNFCDQIQTTYNNLTTHLLPYADKETGAWYQLTALPGQPRNFLESSSTLLFTWSLLKAIRLDLICGSDLKANSTVAALKAYRYAIDSFVIYYNDDGSASSNGGGNGTIGMNQTVAVCSLNSSASYDYYTGRPISVNSLLGESAFVMASLEVEQGFA